MYTRIQLDAVSGLILLCYTFETFARIFAFRWAVFNGSRKIDTFDVLVVIISDITYIWATLTTTMVCECLCVHVCLQRDKMTYMWEDTCTVTLCGGECLRFFLCVCVCVCLFVVSLCT